MDEVFRILVYILAAIHSARLSIRNGRMFGFGVTIIFGTFVYRVFASLVGGLTGPDTAMVGNIGASFLITATLYDMGVDFLRGRKQGRGE